MNEYIYGYSLDDWNSFSAEDQELIESRYEYSLFHEDQKDWFID